MARQIRSVITDEALIKEKRGQIIRCTLRLFVEKGYNRTTARDLLKACKMSQGGLYSYIGTKIDILYLIMEQMQQMQQETIESLKRSTKDLSAGEALQESIKVYMAYADAYQDLIIFGHREIVNLPQNERRIVLDVEIQSVEYFESLLRRGIEAGEFDMKDPRLVAHNILLICDGWALRRWFLRKYYTVEQYSKEQIDIILEKVKVDSGVAQRAGLPL